MKKQYAIIGYITIDEEEVAGYFETNMSLHDLWDILYKIFKGDKYQEGLVARRIK